MIITKHEAAGIYRKKVNAISRAWSKCPYEPTQKFTLKVERNGKLIPFAYCTVRSVRPVTVEDYEKDHSLATSEGFSGIDAWKLALDMRGATQLYRISFNVNKLHEQLLKEQANAQARRKADGGIPSQKNARHKIN